jgi:NTE family protein
VHADGGDRRRPSRDEPRAPATDADQPGELVGDDPQGAAAADDAVTDGERCDLVLGGGGVRGLAHLGVLQALDAAGYEVVRVAGASAGAVVGAFAVAGVPAARATELFDALDFTGFALADVVERWSSARAIGSLVARLGPDRTDPLEWIGRILEEHGVRTFGDLAVTDPDPHDPPERRYRLVVRCLDVVQRRVVRLPWDYQRYGLDPDRQSVAEAVRASMSIPFVYSAVPIGSEGGDQPGLLIDGGLTSGFPVTILDRRDGGRPRWPTFGIRLLARPPGDGALPEGELAMARMVMQALLDSSDLLEPLTSCDEARTVRVDVSDVRALDLDVATEHDLADEGRIAMQRFLADWDFDAYLQRCRS